MVDMLTPGKYLNQSHNLDALDRQKSGNANGKYPEPFCPSSTASLILGS